MIAHLHHDRIWNLSFGIRKARRVDRLVGNFRIAVPLRVLVPVFTLPMPTRVFFRRHGFLPLQIHAVPNLWLLAFRDIELNIVAPKPPVLSENGLSSPSQLTFVCFMQEMHANVIATCVVYP